MIIVTGGNANAETAVCGQRMAHRIWKETKQQPNTAGPGNMLDCYLVSFHFLLAILWPHPVTGVYTVSELSI